MRKHEPKRAKHNSNNRSTDNLLPGVILQVDPEKLIFLKLKTIPKV